MFSAVMDVCIYHTITLPHTSSHWLNCFHIRFGWVLLATDLSLSLSHHSLCASTSFLRPFFHIMSHHSCCCHNTQLNLSVLIRTWCCWSLCIRSLSRLFALIKVRSVIQRGPVKNATTCRLASPAKTVDCSYCQESQHCHLDVRASEWSVQQLHWLTSRYFTSVSSLICIFPSGYQSRVVENNISACSQ